MSGYIRRSFADSVDGFRSPRSVLMILLLTAGAVLLGSHFRMTISDDLRVSFSFVCVMAAGVLFGAVPCMFTAAASDMIAYLIESDGIRGYSPAILAVKLLTAFFCGIMLYRKHYGSFGIMKRLSDLFPECVVLNLDIAARSVLVRTAAVFAGNVVLNSAVLYREYHNGSFPFISGAEWEAFWVWFRPRLEKNLEMLPVELAMVFLLMPLINIAYTLSERNKPEKAERRAAESA